VLDFRSRKVLRPVGARPRLPPRNLLAPTTTTFQMMEPLVKEVTERLCIVTPDNLYGLLLREAKFPTFDTRVIAGSSQLSSLAVDFFPNAFLLFSPHVGPTLLSKLLIDIRYKFPKSQIFQIDGVQEPRISMIWPRGNSEDGDSPSLDASSVELIDLAIRQLSEPQLVITKQSISLTRSQLGAIQALAAGQSNLEIAESRRTQLRAVEMLLKRSLKRIGVPDDASSRSKGIFAQKYLNSIG